MADLETYYATTNARRPNLLPRSDCRKFNSDCVCIICQKNTAAGEGDVESIFDDFNEIVPSKVNDLSRHMYLLCPSQIPAFIFKWRIWRKFCCHRVHLLSWRTDVIFERCYM